VSRWGAAQCVGSWSKRRRRRGVDGCCREREFLSLKPQNTHVDLLPYVCLCFALTFDPSVETHDEKPLYSGHVCWRGWSRGKGVGRRFTQDYTVHRYGPRGSAEERTKERKTTT